MCRRAVVSALMVMLIAALFPTAAVAAAGSRGRVSGADRYETAARIALRAFPGGAPVAYLARGDVAADALAAGALTDGPVLLVPSCGRLPQPVQQALASLDPDQVIGLGGEAAICSGLLEATGISSSRLAGSDRYATAAEIARRAFPDGAPVVYLARSDVAADALAAGALTDGPVLLVPRDAAPPAVVEQAIADLQAEDVVALGGQAAVAASTLERAAGSRAAYRIAGSNRYATAVLVAMRAFPDGAPVVYLARGDVAADALAAGALTDGPVVLTPACRGLPDATAGMLSMFGSARVVALGGISAVCENLLDAAAGATVSSDWLMAVNVFRRAGGLTPATTQPAWTSDATAAARYMIKTNTMTHQPDPNSPHYTEGAATGARNSNVMVSKSDERSEVVAVEDWMRSPGPAAWITHPHLARAAYGSYADPAAQGWRWSAALDVIRGTDHQAGVDPMLWPGRGGRVPIIDGVDKLEGCAGTGLVAHVRPGGAGRAVKRVEWQDEFGTAVGHCVSNQLTGAQPRTDVTWIQADSPLTFGRRYSLTVELTGGQRLTSTFDVVLPSSIVGYPAR